MNRQQFLNILSKKLKHLPHEERDSALAYYTEYLDEAGRENEAPAIQSLPHPSHLAAKILAEFNMNEADVPVKKKKSISMFTILFAVLSAPITIPLALSVLLLGLSCLLVLGLFAMIPFLFLVLTVTVLAGFLIIIIPAFTWGFATGLTFLGMLCLTFGLFGLLTYGLFRLLSITYSALKRTISNFVVGRYSHETQ